MSTTTLQKSARPNPPGSVIFRYILGKFDAVRYLPKLAYGVLQFSAAGVLTANDSPVLKLPSTICTANGAIPILSGVYFIEKTSAAAMTVAAPTVAQDGTQLEIIAGTNFAHVVTFTGSTLLDGTTGAKITATTAAFIGSGITVVARNGKWLLQSNVVATIA
jgi:hypothetical protein